mgnify:CR=1 FL=1
MRLALAAAFWISLAAPGFAEDVDVSVDDTTISLGNISPLMIEKSQEPLDFSFADANIEPRFRLGIAADEDRQAAYASAGFDFSSAEIDLGRPPSILDAGPLPKGAPGVPQALRALVAEAALDEKLGAGFRIAGNQGNISFGTSYHAIEQSSLSVLGVAGRYDLNAFEGIDNVAVYGGAESDGEEQRFRLGTEITQGIATAGVDLLKSNEDQGRTLSQIYLGLAVTPNVSLGVSGLRDTLQSTDRTDTRLGLGASIATQGGAFIAGGVDGVTSDDPAFGLSVGFEF